MAAWNGVPRESAIDARIERLETTTLAGQRLTRRKLSGIQESVAALPLLSRTELAHTICEYMGWRTPRGRNRQQLALRVLEEMERLGLVRLPAKRHAGPGANQPLRVGAGSAAQAPVRGPLSALRPVRLEMVTAQPEIGRWNEWVQRYHPLGYRRPLGVHLRYYLRDRQQRLLGCLLFDFAARQLACRDAWIGWTGAGHRKQLQRIVRNARYLLLPWVTVPHLASHALGLVGRQVAGDWQRQHGYRPVLLETYVDPSAYRGTCYRAANWQYVGLSRGGKARRGRPAQARKAVYVYALEAGWREQLLRGVAR